VQQEPTCNPRGRIIITQARTASSKVVTSRSFCTHFTSLRVCRDGKPDVAQKNVSNTTGASLSRLARRRLPHLAGRQFQILSEGKLTRFCVYRDRQVNRRPLELFRQQSHCARKTGSVMWRRNCPVCRQPLEKKNPADTVPCSCGKFVWRG
jgi:hypothetical protein